MADPVTVPVDLDNLRRVLGLPEDATEEQIQAKLTEVSEATAATPPVEDPKPVPEVTPPTSTPPNGTVTIDQETLASLQRNAQLGAQAFERDRSRDRDTFLSAAVSEGKFPPARVQHWKDAWETEYKHLGNADGIKATIDAMPAGLIPIGSIGVTPSEEVVQGVTYPTNWLPELYDDQA